MIVDKDEIGETLNTVRRLRRIYMVELIYMVVTQIVEMTRDC
jgi:hypothetical protein